MGERSRLDRLNGDLAVLLCEQHPAPGGVGVWGEGPQSLIYIMVSSAAKWQL